MSGSEKGAVWQRSHLSATPLPAVIVLLASYIVGSIAYDSAGCRAVTTSAVQVV